MENVGTDGSKKAILLLCFLNSVLLSIPLFIQTTLAMGTGKKSSLGLSCSACNKSFSSSFSSTNHAINQHLLHGYSHKCFHGKCDYVTTRWPIGLIGHHAKEHEDKLSTCMVCAQSYTEKRKLIDRMMNISVDEGLNEHKKLELINTTIQMLQYIKLGQTEKKQILLETKLTNQFDCSVCEKRFSNPASLKLHEEKHGEKETSSKFPCAHTQKCIERGNKYFLTYNGYMQHHRDFHYISALRCDIPSCKKQHEINSRLHRRLLAKSDKSANAQLMSVTVEATSMVREVDSESNSTFDETIFELPMELIQSNLSSEITDECDLQVEDVSENQEDGKMKDQDVNDIEWYECCGQKFYLGDLIIHEIEQHNKFGEQNPGLAEENKELTDPDTIQESSKKRKNIDLNEIDALVFPNKATIRKNYINLANRSKFMINGHCQSN